MAEKTPELKTEPKEETRRDYDVLQENATDRTERLRLLSPKGAILRIVDPKTGLTQWAQFVHD